MQQIKKLVILGTGGNSIDILDTVNDLNSCSSKNLFECVGFLDDNESVWGSTLHGVKVLGPLCCAKKLTNCVFVNGIGSPSNFYKKHSIIRSTGIPEGRFETIVHPTATISGIAKLGMGTVIFQNVTITSNVRIGNHVIVLPNSVISHDDVIGDYTCVASGVCISGGVEVGRACYLGSNSSIIGNVRIGECSLIGMGSVVLENVPPNSVFAGNPARFSRSSIKESHDADIAARSAVITRN